MDKKNRRILAALLAGILCVTGMAFAANEGTASDPLVTLSYLQQTVTPGVLEQVDEKVEARAQQLKTALDQAIADYSGRMEQALAGAESGGANFQVVTLSKGQTLHPQIGCEVMLRVGSASCVASSSPGLIDSTDGTTLNDGGALKTNHLYLATIEDRGVLAGSATVKVLVRGGYTVS